jgi:hypothetical protein
MTHKKALMILELAGDEPMAEHNCTVISIGAAAQDAVVYKFNPSGAYRVQQAKLLSAALVQVLRDEHTDRAAKGLGHTWQAMYENAMIMVCTACMWAVRVVTDGR